MFITTKTPLFKLSMLLLFCLLMASCNKSDDSEPTPTSIPGISEKDTQVIPIACSDCDHVVDSPTIDGDVLGIQPGATICLNGYYNHTLTFINIKGTVDKPIIIKNCDEKVATVDPANRPFGIKFQKSEHFKLLGNGGGDSNYGIKVSTDNGFFLTLQTYTTNFEVARVEIAGKSTNRSGFAGIGVKTSPYEDCNAFTDPNRAGWIMKDIILRDNYIHDTDGEGMYIGHGFYNGRTESQCGFRTYSHSIHGVKIFNNTIENTGLDGIQMKNCDKDVEVYGNVIKRYARKGEGAHDEGIYIGDGTTGKFYNNIIIDGGTGIMIHGMGNLDIYNNVVINATDFALAAYHGASVYRFPDGYFNIFNNTFHNTSNEYAYCFYNGPNGNNGGAKRLVNNIFVSPNLQESKTFFRSGTVTFDQISNNLLTRSIDEIKFADFAQNNLSILSGSPAIDAGIDLKSFGITLDIKGEARPKGANFDQGAYEVQ